MRDCPECGGAGTVEVGATRDPASGEERICSGCNGLGIVGPSYAPPVHWM